MPNSRTPSHGNSHYFPRSDSDEDYNTYFRRPPGGHDPSALDSRTRARGGREDFDNAYGGYSTDEVDDNDAWGPPDEAPGSTHEFEDRGGVLRQRHRGSRSARDRPDFSTESPIVRPSRTGRHHSPLPSPVSVSRARRHRPSMPNHHRDDHGSMSYTGSSHREDSPSPSSAASAPGSEFEQSPPLTGNFSDEDLLKAIELSRMAGEEQFSMQQREQDELIERLLEESKEEARAADAKKQKQQKRLLQEQERQEQEAIEASKAIAEAQNRKRVARENAFIEESRKEARRTKHGRGRGGEREQVEEAEEENAVLEASRREVEAKEEEELAMILEKSRLEAQSNQRGGGLAFSQFAARQGMVGIVETPTSPAPAREPPSSESRVREPPVSEPSARENPALATSIRQTPARAPATELAASDEDMEEIMRQIAEVEARQAQAEREFGGTAASSNEPRTAAQIEADNETDLRAALAQSLGDEGAPAVDPDEGISDPPPNYGEALASGDSTLVMDDRTHHRSRRSKSKRGEQIDQSHSGDTREAEDSVRPPRRKHRKHREVQDEQRPDGPV